MRLVPPPVITVDGPSGAGKGTLCRALAQQLGWHLLDSGVIYRLLALAAERHHIDITAEAQLVALATDLEARFITDAEGVHVLLAGQEVTLHLAEERVGAAASRLAVLPAVRAALLHRQRVFRQFPGLVADGRDMGTVVFPDAIAKIFLYASLEARTQRRLQQLQQKGFSVRFEQLLQEMRERDQRDTARSVAALVAAEDALLLDSTTLPIERVIDQALHYIQRQSAFSVRQCQV